MDWDLLSLLTPIEWVGDRLLLADVKPRHIGRVITFYVEDVAPPGTVDRVGSMVVGTLEGVDGDQFLVSGSFYNYDDMSGIKIWRRVIKK